MDKSIGYDLVMLVGISINSLILKIGNEMTTIRKRWSTLETKQLNNMIAQGKNEQEIAQVLGRTIPAITTRISKSKGTTDLSSANLKTEALKRSIDRINKAVGKDLLIKIVNGKLEGYVLSRIKL